MKNRRRTFTLTSRFAALAMVALLAFVLNLRYRQWRNLQEVEKEKKSLEEQILSLEGKNRELADSLSYFNSGDFKERLARQQLNLKREGEVVFGFSDAQPALAPQDSQPNGYDLLPNYRKWLEYFFGNSKNQ